MTSPASLRLPALMDTTFAERLVTELRHARGLALEIDAADVVHLGGLCLQALLAARLSWTRDGLSLRIVEPSGAFREAALGYGASMLITGDGA